MKVAGASGVGATLAGCISSNDGGGGGEGQGDKISMDEPSEAITVKWAGDQNFKKAQSDINKALHDAGLSEKITVEVVEGSFTTGDRRTKYKNILDAGQQTPTLLMMDNGWTIPFIARDQIMNLSDALPKSMIDEVNSNYFEASVSTATMDGSLYAIPLFADFPTIQYRKDLVEEAGYDPEGENWATEPMNWQKFSEVTKKTMDETDAGMGFTFQAAAYEGLSCCDFNEFMSSWGGAYFGDHDNLFGPIGDRPITVTEQPVVDSIKMMRTFIHGENDPQALDGITGNIAPTQVLQMKEETSREPFTKGNAVMHRNWPYSIVINGAEDAFGEDLGVMPIPYGVKAGEAKYEGTGGPVAALGGWHLALNPNATDAKKSAAAQVLKTLQTEQAQLALFEIGGWIPPVPSRLESDKAKELDVIGRYVDTLKIAGENAIPRPATRVWNQQSSQISQEVNAALQQNKTPKKAMESLKESLEQIESSA
ncbi:extracellular solute-binding protein [Haloarchaeobius sp. DFWS5]|uniref:extracellular solute-binding protein n=1 Tax=Haloarchaeobius sp. DFWS5 TaxID=3446114 RepID=UPI003EBF4499